MRTCETPIADEALLDYWAGDGDAERTEALESHLFGCESCAGRLEQLAALDAGVATLVRQGRLSGMISRGMVNRLQRDGVRVRLFSLSPGETVPCAAFPSDDVMIAALRADFSEVQGVALSVVGPDGMPMPSFEEIPVSPSEREVYWALPGALVRQFPSMRLELTLTSAGEDRAVLGEYVLEHSGGQPAPR